MSRSPASPITWRRAVHVGTAGVWLHQGLWCKVLRRDREHHEVLASVPGPLGRHAGAVGTALGLAESALAVLVAVRGGRRSVAALQTGLIVAFNTGGLVLARPQIDDPVGLLARNATLISAIWAAVDRGEP